MDPSAKSLVIILLIAVISASVVFTAGCTGSMDGGAATESPTATATVTVTETATPTGTQTVAPTENPNTFTSDGSGGSTVSLTKGSNLITISQISPYPANVTIETEKDLIYFENNYTKESAPLAKGDGKYTYSYAFMLEDDAEATFSIDTESEWTATFGFPEMINGIPPQTFEGIGDMATPFFQINSGDYNVSIKTVNNTVVEVSLMDYYGNPVFDGDKSMPLPLSPGVYDGTVPVTITESENYLLNIVCDGEWTVSVEEA